MPEDSKHLRRNVLEIQSSAGGLFDLLLPTCDASILSKVLDPRVPWVTMINYWSKGICNLVEQNLPSLFGQDHRTETVQIKLLDMDVCLPTLEFLDVLSQLTDQGVEVVQSLRPLPNSLSVSDLNPGSKARVYREVGITLQFFLPHAHEYALVTSPSLDVLRQILAGVSDWKP